jgi:hypothetical protein
MEEFLCCCVCFVSFVHCSGTQSRTFHLHKSVCARVSRHRQDSTGSELNNETHLFQGVSEDAERIRDKWKEKYFRKESRKNVAHEK